MKYIFIFIVAIQVHVSFAQTRAFKKSPLLLEATPASAGMSSERLSRIDSMCRQAIAENQIPGAVALVARQGKIVYYKAFGKADNESGRVLSRNDIFRIASQTKAITATAVMMLWEQGKFQLDDPIEKYIPEFKGARLLDTLYENGKYGTTAAAKSPTIRQLLTHTSGVGYGEIDADKRIKKIYQQAGITDLFTTENISIGESVRKLAKLPLLQEPGKSFHYSEGLDVLGYFIEIISGTPLDQFFRTRILDPLGMNDTWFYLPESKQSRLVSVQKKEGDQWVKYPVTFYDPDYPIKGAKRFFSGGAGLSSTAIDYAKLLQMLLNKGEYNGIRILSRTTVNMMLANQIGNIWEGTGNYFSLAFRTVDETGAKKGGNGSEGTFSWGGYFNTQYFADPKEQIIGIIMKQTQGPTGDNTSWNFPILVEQAVDD